MASIPTKTIDFNLWNTWGIQNREVDLTYRFGRLFHAAVTTGHGPNWRQIIGAQVGGQMEMIWKATALLTTVRQRRVRIFDRPSTGRRKFKTVSRLVPTDRFSAMDPSEKRGLTYHMGMTLATAWARLELNVPWLLHLDVYKDQLDPNLPLGNSRPDLVGRNLGGSWISVECKGRSSPPDATARGNAKIQAQRIVDIGGVVPSLCLGILTFFGSDSVARGKPKPRVVKTQVIDPPGGESPEPISLPLLNDYEFFRLYYEPLLSWFMVEDDRLVEEELFTWRSFEDLDLRIGILTKLKSILDNERYGSVPEVMGTFEEEFNFLEQYPNWAGDGLLTEFGDSWKKSTEIAADEDGEHPN